MNPPPKRPLTGRNLVPPARPSHVATRASLDADYQRASLFNSDFPTTRPPQGAQDMEIGGRDRDMLAISQNRDFPITPDFLCHQIEARFACLCCISRKKRFRGMIPREITKSITQLTVDREFKCKLRFCENPEHRNKMRISPSSEKFQLEQLIDGRISVQTADKTSWPRVQGGGQGPQKIALLGSELWQLGVLLGMGVQEFFWGFFLVSLVVE